MKKTWKLSFKLEEMKKDLLFEREAREEESRRQAEAKRRKEERQKKYNEEVERTIALENAALDYETACRIRAYGQTQS